MESNIPYDKETIVQENMDEKMHQKEEEVANHLLRFDSKIVASEHDSEPIEILVSDPVTKDGLSKYIVYTIRGNDRDGPFQVFRRFSEFYKLREVLILRWPGCYVPPLPPKKSVGNLEGKFVEDRMSHLNEFCSKLAELKHLFYSQEFKIFLRHAGPDLEKEFNTLPKMTYEDVINKYQANFRMLSGKEINTDVVIKISTFEAYLKKVKAMMDNFKEMAKNASKTRKQFNDQFNTFSAFLMPEYEKNCLSEYINGGDDRLVFGRPGDIKYSELVATLKDISLKENGYEKISDCLKAESRELAAMQEAIQIKKVYEGHKEKAQQKQKELQLELQKVLAGKTTMKSFFSSGKKEDTIANLEKNIQNASKEMENLQFLTDIIMVILGYIEIDRFKREKEAKYYEIIKLSTQSELQYLKAMKEFWAYIESNPNLGNN